MSAKQFKATVKPKANKYGAKKAVVDGKRFDSKREAARYQFLKARQDLGEISNLELQPAFKLKCGDRPILLKSKGYPNGRQATYFADFAYWCPVQEKRIIEDSKGMKTDVYKLKKAIVEAQFPGVKIIEV
ncbi:DUF1064 domain-containing protein [Rhizobium giardinii]|uniref:DUF1064 domain-containing protein n=1 Tax=Rhizobium giardinii TaxID=56731 RepID=UPI0039E15BC0